MRWQLAGPWPIGAQCLPAGTIISDGESWPMPPPLNAVPLDAEAALLMLRSYDESLWHRLVFVHDLDRDAVIARAAHERRYGRQAAVAVAIADTAASPPAAMADSPLRVHLPQKEEPPAPPAPRSTTRKRK